MRALATSSPSRAYQTLKQHVLDQGELPDLDATLPLLFKELARARESEAYVQLASAVQGPLAARCSGGDTTDEGVRRDMQVLNLMLRSYAKLDVDEAIRRCTSLLDQGVVIESQTYSQLAASSLAAGNFEQSEMMLEYRDYL